MQKDYVDLAKAIWNSIASTDWYSESANEFTISTAECLAGFAKLVNNGNDFAGKTIKLGANIALNDIANFSNWETSAPANIWNSIGKLDKFMNRFMGTFDGGGYIIYGAYINSTRNHQGLFGHVGFGGEIKNLGLAYSFIKGSSIVGGLAGYNEGGAISNSYFSGTVIGEGYVGGLAGVNGGAINDCYSSIIVKGAKKNVGGLIGNNYGTISNCYSIGKVIGEGYVGGLVGEGTKGAISGSYSASKVMGTDYVGGLVGLDFRGAISNCYSTGMVIGAGNVGGLAGFNENGSISKSYSAGPVMGTSYVGGLVGGNFKGVISNCYSISMVTGKMFVGGLVGDNVGNVSERNSLLLWQGRGGAISNCYSAGAVTGEKNVGGLVGANGHYAVTYGKKVTGTALAGKITNSYYDKQTSEQRDGGNGDGKSTIQMKKESNFIGWDFNEIWRIDHAINNGYPCLITP